MSNTTHDDDDDDPIIGYEARYWLYLIFEIPSILCSFFVLFHLLHTKASRYALNNHIIIILLILNLIVLTTNIPWTIHFYRTGHPISSTYTFCFIWSLMDEGLTITTTLLFAWATIERHILIFHDQWVSTRFKRLCVHYIPTVLLLLYCLCYCLGVIAFPPCVDVYDYDQVGCGFVICYYDDSTIAMWDIVADHLLPSTIITIFSALLLARILYQKKRVRQPIRWRQHRKMAVQLLSISLLYMILYVPSRLLEFAHFCGLSEDIGANFMAVSDFFAYYIYLLFPFICAGSLPNLHGKINRIIFCGQRRARIVVPQVSLVPQTLNNQGISKRIIAR